MYVCITTSMRKNSTNYISMFYAGKNWIWMHSWMPLRMVDTVLWARST